MWARLKNRLYSRPMRRKAVRATLILLNAVLLLGVMAVVVLNPSHASKAPQPTASVSGTQEAASAPVDRVASASIALTAARMAGLPETVAVTNQVDSERIETSVASINSSVVAKPQTVASSFISNKDIHTYVAQPNDTVASIATKFGVSSDSILWSNNLHGNAINTGQKLYIPPMNGIVYTVKSGDTPSSLAASYHSSEDKIIAYNDAEIGGLRVGEQILIPNGSITPAPVFSYASAAGFAWGSSALYGFNGYDYGFCTWYVATQIAVPANWGNANTWDNGARLSGWTVSSVPRAGSIGQTDAGSEGHVAYVYAVSDDGTQIKYRDMNGLAGFARVGDTANYYPGGWVSASHFEHYIYR